jgi:hypothetical protein
MSSAAMTPITIAPTRINVLRELTPRPHSSLLDTIAILNCGPS